MHEVKHDDLVALGGRQALPACGLRNDEAHGYAQVQGCMRRGVRRERAAERGGGHLARARVRTMGPCAL